MRKSMISDWHRWQPQHCRSVRRALMGFPHDRCVCVCVCVPPALPRSLPFFFFLACHYHNKTKLTREWSFVKKRLLSMWLHVHSFLPCVFKRSFLLSESAALSSSVQNSIETRVIVDSWAFNRSAHYLGLSSSTSVSLLVAVSSVCFICY